MAEQGPTPQIDQLLSNVQVRREQAKQAEKPDITTDRKRVVLKNEDGVPKKDAEVFRSPTTRLIRGSLAATLKDIRNDPQMKLDLLPGFASESRRLAEGLDKLDYQFHNNGKFIDAGKGPSERDSIYGVELDLNEPKPDTEDTRTPYVMIGGTTSTSEQNASLSMGLALEGNKVVVLTFPEQMRAQAGGRNILDKISNVGEDNIKMFKEAIRHLGYEKVNLIGHSFGGAAVIEIASDPAFTKEVGVHDVVSLAPSSFERRTVINPKDNIGTAFMKEGALTMQDPEANVMMAEQGNIDAHRRSGTQPGSGIFKPIKEGLDFMSGGRAAATKMIDADKIANQAVPNITGRLEVWTGLEDPVCRAEPVQATLKEAVAENPAIKDKVFSYRVAGARHDSFITNALGLVGALHQESGVQGDVDPASRIGMGMSLDSLKRSGAEVILEKMKKQATPRRAASQ